MKQFLVFFVLMATPPAGAAPAAVPSKKVKQAVIKLYAEHRDRLNVFINDFERTRQKVIAFDEELQAQITVSQNVKHIDQLEAFRNDFKEIQQKMTSLDTELREKRRASQREINTLQGGAKTPEERDSELYYDRNK